MCHEDRVGCHLDIVSNDDRVDNFYVMTKYTIITNLDSVILQVYAFHRTKRWGTFTHKGAVFANDHGKAKTYAT